MLIRKHFLQLYVHTVKKDNGVAEWPEDKKKKPIQGSPSSFLSAGTHSASEVPKISLMVCVWGSIKNRLPVQFAQIFLFL